MTAAAAGLLAQAIDSAACSTLGELILLHISGISRRTGWVATITCALAAAVALAGCGKKQEEAAVVGQVIAHVGTDDVTQQEVDNELNLARVPADKRSDEVVKAGLSRIIERKYLAQQARAAKLDREPTVHLDMLRANEQILAGAYMQRDLSTKASSISQNEVDSYIQAHPDQFEKRQLYQIEQVTFAPQKDMESLAASTKDFNALDQVEGKLNQLGIKFDRGTGTLDGATIPPEMRKALLARKPNDIFFLRSTRAASFFKVVSVDDKPLSGPEADQFAKAELRNDLARKTGQETYNAALASAKYEGDYARIMATAPAAPTPAAGEAQGGEKPGEAPAAEKSDAEKEPKQ
jgi:EpsD family peptidyl-prolyl cis-trans isomerase